MPQTTPISRITNAFISAMKIEAGKEVFLSFDGERLTSESTVADTDLDDMDFVDCYVK